MRGEQDARVGFVVLERIHQQQAKQAETGGDRHIQLADPLTGGCHGVDHGAGLSFRKEFAPAQTSVDPDKHPPRPRARPHPAG